MRVRLMLVAVVLVGLPVLAEWGSAGGTRGAGAWAVRSAVAAPSATDLTELQFSTAVNDRAEPIDPRVEFGSDTESVWVSFGYSNHDPSTKVSYLVRANGDDFQWDDLDCCGGREGRYAFPIERRSGRDLGGAAYEVRIYMSDAEVALGGFGVRGTQAFDDNDNEGGGGGNDNN